MLYRRKPGQPINAEQWPVPHHPGVQTDAAGAYIETIHEGQRVYLKPGDWILPEPDGVHFYPCKPDIFAATYEPAAVERLQDDEVYPCEYCRAMVAAPCTDGSQAQACYARRITPKRPPDVAEMPPGARADAMRHDPEWRAQPIGASPRLVGK